MSLGERLGCLKCLTTWRTGVADCWACGGPGVLVSTLEPSEQLKFSSGGGGASWYAAEAGDFNGPAL